MPKKLFAVTNIKSGPDKFYAAGSELDPKELGLTKEQLLELHREGAVELRVVEDEEVKEEVSTPDSDEAKEETVGGSSVEL